MNVPDGVPEIVDLHEVSSPVVLFANAIGDHLLTLPAMRALTHLFPEKLGLIGYRVLATIFYRDLPFKWICFPELSQGRDGVWRFDAVDVASRVGHCDLFLSLNPWHSASLEHLLDTIKPGLSLGFSEAFGIARSWDHSKHAADTAFEVPAALVPALEIDRFSAPFRSKSNVIGMAREMRSKIPDSFQILAIHADTKPEKMWPWARWERFIEMFLARNADFVVMYIGERRRSMRHLTVGDNRVIPCGGFPLETSLTLVSLSDFFVGVDSCMLHMADQCRILSVGLFGPTNPLEFGFRFSPFHRHVAMDNSMSSIEPEDVLHAITDLQREISSIAVK